MPNPTIIKLATTTARSVDIAQATRRGASAGEARRDGSAESPVRRVDIFGPEVETVRNTGGEWDPETSRPALESESPLEGGWGGWDEADAPPWNPRSDLSLSGDGGFQFLEKHRETVAGQFYQSYVRGNQNVSIASHSKLDVKGTVTFVAQGGGVGMRSTDGRDHALTADLLEVRGGVTWEAHEKTTMGSCDVERHWNGGILRMIGMEGVICGGAFLKTFTGASMTMAPIASGDVYGGAAHAAANRIRASKVLGYRSTEMAAWACSFYKRSCMALTEPAQGSPAHNPRTNMKQKAGRITLGLNPLFDIGWAIISGVAGLAQSIYAKARRKKAEPDTNSGAPRILTRTVGGVQQQRVGHKIL